MDNILLFAYFQPSQTNYIPIYYLDLNSYCAAITNLCDDMEKLLFQQPFASDLKTIRKIITEIDNVPVE